ncbi:MAG: hypothetical protein C5B54_00010 [Acidobacteria bacterium]|nr:MAG: hypothetical protein C5B54_00010 [Acidobacteriota bacterium]
MRLLRYFKSAFLLRLNVSGLGNIPVNILALLGFLMLGFGAQGFWLLGVGLEIAYLYILGTNKRFQQWVDASETIKTEEDFAQQWRDLVRRLSIADQQRLSKLEQKCDQIVNKYRESQNSEYFVESNQDALRRLAWIYLKLLMAQSNLESLEEHSNKNDLEQKVSTLEKELQNESLLASVRDSKSATLEITRRRLENLDRRQSSLQEVESDLNRIEAQIDLALENAAMQSQPQAISSSIDLFSNILQEQPFGEAQRTIDLIDQRLQQKN